MPQISVIVPVFNVEKYIDRCVQSILGQSFSDFELILVDDGSPDSSGTICDTWAAWDSRIRVIHQKNGGLSAARNAGIGIAQGEYLLFVDSDDVIHPDCLNILMTCIQMTGAQIARAQFERFHTDTLPEGSFAVWDGNCTVRNNLETLDLFFGDIQEVPALVSTCGKLWHKDLFSGIEFPTGRLFEDEFVTYKLYHRAEKIAFCNIAIYFYFVNLHGITQTLTLEKRFDEYDAQWERMAYFQEQNMTYLLEKAVMTFLKTAQWDLIACRSNRESASEEKKRKLEDQYKQAFETAKSLGLLDFLRHYDYFILAYPQYTIIWRIKRQIALHLGKKV